LNISGHGSPRGDCTAQLPFCVQGFFGTEKTCTPGGTAGGHLIQVAACHAIIFPDEKGAASGQSWSTFAGNLTRAFKSRENIHRSDPIGGGTMGKEL
jgi:hypothetical protein